MVLSTGNINESNAQTPPHLFRLLGVGAPQVGVLMLGVGVWLPARPGLDVVDRRLALGDQALVFSYLLASLLAPHLVAVLPRRKPETEYGLEGTSERAIFIAPYTTFETKFLRRQKVNQCVWPRRLGGVG